MDTTVPEFRISLSVILPTAAALAAAAFCLGVLVWRSRRATVRSGMDALVGEFGEVRETIARGRPGQVFVQGELWKATTRGEEEIPAGSLVVVQDTKEMTLIVAMRQTATA